MSAWRGRRGAEGWTLHPLSLNTPGAMEDNGWLVYETECMAGLDHSKHSVYRREGVCVCVSLSPSVRCVLTSECRVMRARVQCRWRNSRAWAGLQRRFCTGGGVLSKMWISVDKHNMRDEIGYRFIAQSAVMYSIPVCIWELRCVHDRMWTGLKTKTKKTKQIY